MKHSWSPLSFTLANEILWLLPQRAIYWEAQGMLLMADVHLGKINHFRKSGLAVPSKADDKNFELLVEMIQQYKPQRIIFLGDLFHSHYNEVWEEFGQLIRYFPEVCFELVLGNHDILGLHQYQKHGIILYQELTIGPYLFTHHPVEDYAGALYNLAGHIHPGVRMIGRGKQYATLPCFHFGEKQGLLPAFGAFTGLARIVPKVNDQVFIIVENKILKV